MKSLTQLVTESLPKFYESAQAIGTIHFARFLPLGTTSLVLFAEYDVQQNNLLQSFAKQMGPLFDEMFVNVVDPPPTPVQKNVGAFSEWASAHNLQSLFFYSAYPKLSVQDVQGTAKAA